MALQDILERKEILLKPNDMTNEEKAREIQANDVCCVWNGGCPNVRSGAMKMAQWKDEQVKQIQEREIKVCNDYIEKHPNNKLMLKYHLGRLSLCDELLGTDSKDKINMAFATMD